MGHNFNFLLYYYYIIILIFTLSFEKVRDLIGEPNLKLTIVLLFGDVSDGRRFREDFSFLGESDPAGTLCLPGEAEAPNVDSN